MTEISPFVLELLPLRILFGQGRIAELGAEVERLGLSRVLVLSTANQEGHARKAREIISSHCVGLFSQATMHTPTQVTEAAVACARQLGVDGVVAIGGGSTTGLGKALAHRLNLPQIVVPTTYAGSEMTPILGETSNGAKTTFRDARLLPDTVIYDVDLTVELPVGFSIASGMNAMAHAVEALYTRDNNPVVSRLAEEGIAALANALPLIAADPSNLAARAQALVGGCLCGICLGTVGMALHHKICHVLGGTFDLPHAELHAVMLPYVVAYNRASVPGAVSRMAEALGSPDPVARLAELIRLGGLPTSLAELGMPEEGIARVAQATVEAPYWNPRTPTYDSILELVSQAWRGELLPRG